MSRSGTLLLVGLICGAAVGGLLSYNLNPKIGEYSATIEALETDYDELERLCQEQVGELSDLRKDKFTLQNEVNQLNTQLTAQIDQYEETANYLKDLSDSVKELNYSLKRYVDLRVAFTQVINEEELVGIGDKVREVVGGSELWPAYEKIYDFVADDVAYAYDVTVPAVGRYWYIGGADEKTLVRFETYTAKNYIQPLNFTLEYRQGDCDDQALLEYAMIRYYNREIVGTDYSVYVAHVEWGNNNSHLAVFSPVAEGNICILDPAGHYLTNRKGAIASKEAELELKQYQEHWVDKNGPITGITLYWIDVDEDRYTVVFEGGLEEAISFFQER